MPGAAGAESGRLADFTMRLSSTTPATPTGFHTQFRLRKEGDPEGKPSPIRSGVIRLPAGLRFDSAAVPQCMASDAEFHARGSDACSAETELTVGSFSAMTGFGPPIDPLMADDHVFNGPNQIIEVVTVPGGSFAPGFDRLTIDGSTLTAHPPVTPGGPPDGETAVRSSDFNVPARVAGGRSLVTTPPDCAADGRWVTVATFSFKDGDSDTVRSVTPCTPSTAASKLRLTVRPGRVQLGRTTRFRFRLRSPATRCIAGARVHLAGQWVRTDAGGRATLTTTLRAPGPHRARAAHAGCGRDRAIVRAVPAR